MQILIVCTDAGGKHFKETT